jgi:osmoprotectant transport system permease protein
VIFGYLLDPAHWPGPDGILWRLGEHLVFTVVSVLVAAVIAIPLGILVGHTGKGGFLAIGTTNAARAVPTLGAIVVIVLLLGTNPLALFIVLVVLAIPPILTATSAGIAGADREAVLAARGLGMTGGQVVRKVEWPLALPLVISGLRSATLQVVATATLGAYVTLGGLGRFIFDGYAVRDYGQVFAGAILVALLAIVLDLVLGGIGWSAGRRSRPGRRTDRNTDRTTDRTTDRGDLTGDRAGTPVATEPAPVELEQS